MHGNALKIPLAAIPERLVDARSTSSRKVVEAYNRLWEVESDEDDEDDIACLLSEDDPGEQTRAPSGPNLRQRSSSVELGSPRQHIVSEAQHAVGGNGLVIDASKTDFRPGALDLGSLPRLGEPSWATEMAAKQLGRDIMALQQIQAKTPLQDLGWYIDFEMVTNLFQWIVEFHSFDPELPLAQDMKKVGATSIVLEIRFPRSYPYEPPFVRVIRPRFLPFMDGGGGHVTGGGAVCMELLTTSGWSPASSMESVLLQVRMAMCSVDPATRQAG